MKIKLNKKNKKAQFYLIASIILIALLLSFVSLINYSIKKSNPEINKYVEELNLEGKKVLDYDLATGENQFQEFAKSYTYYVGEGKEIYFLTGTRSSYDAFRYEGEVMMGLSTDRTGNDVTLDVNGEEFTFELKPGENFYFVMTDNYRSQEYFVTNDE